MNKRAAGGAAFHGTCTYRAMRNTDQGSRKRPLTTHMLTSLAWEGDRLDPPIGPPSPLHDKSLEQQNKKKMFTVERIFHDTDY